MNSNDKILELKKAKKEAQIKAHQEIIDSNKSVEKAIGDLTDLMSKKDFDDSKIIYQLQEIGANITFKADYERLERSLEESSGKLSKSVSSALQAIIKQIQPQETSQLPDNFVPYRRVIMVDGKLRFDDRPTPNSMSSGGGGGKSSVQPSLVRDTTDGQAIAVVNPDGSTISGGGGGGGYANVGIKDASDVRINPATAENQQTDALTDAELRATPLDVDTGLTGLATEDKQDDVIEQLQALRGFQIPVYDEIQLGYTGDNLTTVLYYNATVLQATLTLSYTGANLTKVVLS